MPLHIKVYINETQLHELHIGRFQGGSNPNDINTYLAVVGERPQGLDQWMEGVEYTHRYGDGALVCVQKALEAYNALR